MEVNHYIFSTPEDVAKNFAEWMYLAAMGSENEAVHIALSGGSTPQLLFDELATNYKENFPWERVHFWWGDERCVDPMDIDSNYGVVKARLFDKIDIPTDNVHRILGEVDISSQEAMRYSDEIKQYLEIVDGLPSFDLIILGMGDDGHTASIFPHQLELLESNHVCAVAQHPTSGQERITLTGRVINNARVICFLVTGANKAEKFDEIKNKKGEHERYPANYIGTESGQINWFLDKAVVSE